jgi:isopropylmalate/homocitrate/citramalate synthase
MARRIRVFDTTLRDGEQTPGAALTVDEKVSVAKQLARLRVDVIEAGFPAASPGEAEAVRRIATEVGGAKGAPAIAALARCVPADVTVAAKALEPARKRQLHVFIATSDIHITHKLRSTRPRSSSGSAPAWAQAREMVGPATRSSSAPRTPRAPSCRSCWRPSRPPSRRAHRSSTCRTPSATPSRRSTPRSSARS